VLLSSNVPLRQRQVRRQLRRLLRRLLWWLGFAGKVATCVRLHARGGSLLAWREGWREVRREGCLLAWRGNKQAHPEFHLRERAVLGEETLSRSCLSSCPVHVLLACSRRNLACDLGVGVAPLHAPALHLLPGRPSSHARLHARGRRIGRYLVHGRVDTL
jgi:hypothetical protein